MNFRKEEEEKLMQVFLDIEAIEAMIQRQDAHKTCKSQNSQKYPRPKIQSRLSEVFSEIHPYLGSGATPRRELAWDSVDLKKLPVFGILLSGAVL